MSVTVTSYRVAGMTCGHCVTAVTEEVSAVPGVAAVEIDLVPSGESVVRVTAAEPLPVDVVRAAVAEAGYDLVGS
jgi:copper chaperone CopZ